MRHCLSPRLLIVCSMLGASLATASAQTSPVEKEIMQAIGQINTAFQHRDAKAYEAMTTADFIRVTSQGRAIGRSEWLKTVVAAGAARTAGKYDQLSVRVHGNGAVVTYRNQPTDAKGQPGAVSYLTRVMEKQGTQWKMALAQSTDVKPPVPPTGPEPAALSPVSPATAAEKSAMSAFQTIQKANAARDVAAWEKWAAADHTIIGADGSRTSRAERVAALKAPATAPATTAAPDQQVRLVVKGDLAAITWLAGNARSLKVLALNGGQWQQVLQQSSPIVAATK